MTRTRRWCCRLFGHRMETFREWRADQRTELGRHWQTQAWTVTIPCAWRRTTRCRWCGLLARSQWDDTLPAPVGPAPFWVSEGRAIVPVARVRR